MKVHKKVSEPRIDIEFIVSHKRGFIEQFKQYDSDTNYRHRFRINIDTRANLAVSDQPKPYEGNWNIDELIDLRDALNSYLDGVEK